MPNCDGKLENVSDQPHSIYNAYIPLLNNLRFLATNQPVLASTEQHTLQLIINHVEKIKWSDYKTTCSGVLTVLPHQTINQGHTLFTLAYALAIFSFTVKTQHALNANTFQKLAEFLINATMDSIAANLTSHDNTAKATTMYMEHYFYMVSISKKEKSFLEYWHSLPEKRQQAREKMHRIIQWQEQADEKRKQTNALKASP